MGLDTRTDRTLWKDRAMPEPTTAVLHSFDAAGCRPADTVGAPLAAR
jgi:nitric-oxide synthase, bacterial